MNGTKVWWQSKTVWGSIIALLAGIATLIGVDLGADLQNELVEIVIGGAGVVGGVLAWYGRYKAQGRITGGEQ